jgi:hypothetical protein
VRIEARRPGGCLYLTAPDTNVRGSRAVQAAVARALEEMAMTAERVDVTLRHRLRRPTRLGRMKR